MDQGELGELGSYQSICVDTAMGSQFNIHHPGVWAYLWKLAEGGFIKAVIGGPPCRTTSRLRNRGPPGPRRLRGRDDERWHLDHLDPFELELVSSDRDPEANLGRGDVVQGRHDIIR